MSIENDCEDTKVDDIQDENAEDENANTAYIAKRTRTKLSLVDIPIDSLETLLHDAIETTSDLSDAGDEYQKFLSSLLPSEPANLSFLSDEDDEEYHPEDDEFEAINDKEKDTLPSKISKKELTELLWDSTHSKFTEDMPQNLRNKISRGEGSRPHLRHIRPNEKMRDLGDLHGTMSKEQCIQLASQIHKHFQLLLQSFHAIEQQRVKHDTAAWRTYNTMLATLHARGVAAIKCKSSLLSRFNPQLPEDDASALSLRRVTRSLSAAHAAVAHPSMFDVTGIQAVDEICRDLQAKCSVDKRNDIMRKHMLALDDHLLRVQKSAIKRKFSESEDNLLAHGARRFGVKSSDSWRKIQQNFLPSKDLHLIKQRFRYLTSSKTGMNAAKQFHTRFPSRRTSPWLVEEEIRIVRGMFEFENDPKKFARIAIKYLPHRTRSEVRKKWEKMKNRFLERYVAGTNDEFLMSSQSVKLSIQKMKDFLEQKTNQLYIAPSGASMNHPMVGTSSLTSFRNRQYIQALKNAELQRPAKLSYTNTARVELHAQKCSIQNLHPALFFTPWAVLCPSILLKHTCEHNWPTSFEDKATPLQPGPVTPDSGHQMNKIHRFRSTQVSSDGLEDDEKEDEDSEYEHEVIASSESDLDSDGEFEQLELSDDEGGEATFGSPGSDQTRMRHTLRLRNLPNTDEKTRRALAALERRITGAPLPSPELYNGHSSLTHHALSSCSSDVSDGEFECEELLPSSESEYAEDDDFDGNDMGLETWVRKRKMECSTCNFDPCVCSQNRMKKLLRRMYERSK